MTFTFVNECTHIISLQKMYVGFRSTNLQNEFYDYELQLKSNNFTAKSVTCETIDK